jgi:hypothetical protein
MRFYADLVLRNTLGWPESRLLKPETLQRVDTATVAALPTASACSRAAKSAVALSVELGGTPLLTDLEAVGLATVEQQRQRRSPTSSGTTTSSESK